MKIDLFIKRYGHYIKQKASIYDKNNFFIKKELISHNLDTLANDMKDLCELFLAA